MSALSLAALRSVDAAALARLGAWAFVAVSLAVFMVPAGAIHVMPFTVCAWPPGEPCALLGYGVVDTLASTPILILRSAAVFVVGAEALARCLGDAHVSGRRLAVLCGVLVVSAAALFYGLGVVEALYVTAWHVERAFFVASVVLGAAASLGLWHLSVWMRASA